MKRLPFVFLVILVLAGCGACSAAGKKDAGKEPEPFIAALWNVQALFDGIEQGSEYGDYREASLWTGEKYTARITAISQAVTQMAQPEHASNTASPKTQFPGIIGFVEVENSGVLEDLARFDQQKRGYYWTAFTALPGSSIGIGIISRFPIIDARAHSITIEKDTAPRPVLEVRIAPMGRPMVFLLCHWKSKLGGEDQTEPLRRASARVVSRRVKEIIETEGGMPVIVMGDLNENHDEFFRRSGKIFSALLPDDPDAAAAAGQNTGAREEFLVLSGEKPPRSRYFPGSTHALFSPWAEELSGGTYFYRGGWETIDHFLLSDGLFDGSGWEYDSVRVADHAPFTKADGTPNTYIPRYGRGLSDHLPVILHLQFVE